MPPAFADAASPTTAELRRRAIWTNWRGIADLAPGGGFGELYGSLAPVPGTEFHALREDSTGASQPHRVMVQVPDDFDAEKRCVSSPPSSGSRGIYGAIALAGSWGLPHRLRGGLHRQGRRHRLRRSAAVAAHRLDGTPRLAGEAAEFSAARDPRERPAIAVKHAHSGDNPEADWGRHVQQAAQFALQVLGAAHPDDAPFTFANTRVIAAGVSNGGGAVLRAAELAWRLARWRGGDFAERAAAARVAARCTTTRPKPRSTMPCALNAAALRRRGDGAARRQQVAGRVRALRLAARGRPH